MKTINYESDSITILFLTVFVVALLCVALVFGQSEKQDAKNEILTVYGSDGRPLYQSQDSKGWHRVIGSVTLSSGEATVTLNTSTSDGRQNISFQSSTSYRGYVNTVVDADKVNIYSISQNSGTSFDVFSDDGSDNSTVYYIVEGY